MILLPKHKEIIRDAGALTYQVSGHFRIVARSRRYKGERVLADFDNLILDQGLLRLAQSSATSTPYIQLGTGTTAPANDQTALTSYSSSISNNISNTNSYVPGPPSYGQVVRQMRGTVGGNTGTFSEIGYGWASVGSLFSRALILDAGGNPTTITVLSDEQLDVFYTFRWYFPLSDTSGTVTIAGSNYNWVCRSANITYLYATENFLRYGLFGQRTGTGDRIYSSDATLGSVTGSLSANSFAGSSAVQTAHSNPNLYVDTISTFPLTSTPSGGVGALGTFMFSANVATAVGIQTSFTPAIPKLSSQILTLTTRASVARYP
jgi:hypothetical protein